MQKYPTIMRFFQQRSRKGISDLTADKKNLMMLVCQQLVQATGEEYQYEQTDITVKMSGTILPEEEKSGADGI